MAAFHLYCPNECLKEVTVRVVGRTSESDDVALLINCRRRIPKQGPEVADVSHSAILPKHSMLRGVSSNSLVANT